MFLVMKGMIKAKKGKRLAIVAFRKKEVIKNYGFLRNNEEQ